MKKTILVSFLIAALGAGAVRAEERASTERTQARSVLRENNSAQTSAGAGRTYDGSAQTTAGGAAESIAGPVGGAAQPKTFGGTSSAKAIDADPPVPTPASKGISTAWERLLKRAIALAMLATVLGLAGTLLKKTTGPFAHYAVMAIGAAMIGIGIYMGVLAGQILAGTNGEPGQQKQGIIVAVLALATIASGVMMMMGAPDAKAKPVTTGSTPAPVPEGMASNMPGDFADGFSAPATAPTPAPVPEGMASNMPGDFADGFSAPATAPTPAPVPEGMASNMPGDFAE